MIFEWDPKKCIENIHKHHIDFVDAPSVFSGPMLVRLDKRREYDEDRWIGFGLLGVIVVAVVFVERRAGVIRIISARKANQYERQEFEEYFG